MQIPRHSRPMGDEQQALAEKIARAQERLQEIEFSDEVLEKIVEITTALSLDGHRGDIVIMRTAQALAALRNRRYNQ